MVMKQNRTDKQMQLIMKQTQISISQTISVDMPKISRQTNKQKKQLVQTIFIFNVRESSETKGFTNKAFH